MKREDSQTTFTFAKHIAQFYQQGEKLDWKKAQKIAKDFGIETDTEIMQACELGCVIEARRIAHNGNSLAQQYEEMKDLYDRQVNIKPLDTKSKVLNQYSTPCPLAYLLGTFVNQNHKMNDGKILEPSAGNGLLTTVFNPKDVCVNELDEIRVENLRKLGFYNVANIDASEKTLLDNEYQDKSFRGIITNPPFAKLPSDKKIQRNGWEINTLDYKMAVLALDKMHDDGRASIIVGGKMWNSYWKPLNETSQKQVLFGQWKTFLGYLYAQYNVVDVIYVDGDNIYRKQGTQYPIAIILIDGRHKYDESNKPRYVFDPDKDVILTTFDQLFDRIKQCLSVDEAKPGREETFTYKPQNYRTIKEYKEKFPFGWLVDSVWYNHKIVAEHTFDVENNKIFREYFSIPLDVLFREKKGRDATPRELIYFGKKYAKMGFYVVSKHIGFGERKDDFEKFIKSEFTSDDEEEAKHKRAKALLLLAQAKIKIAKAELIIKKNI